MRYPYTVAAVFAVLITFAFYLHQLPKEQEQKPELVGKHMETIAVGNLSMQYPMPNDCIMLEHMPGQRRSTKMYDCPAENIRVQFAFEENGTEWKFYVVDIYAPHKEETVAR